MKCPYPYGTEESYKWWDAKFKEEFQATLIRAKEKKKHLFDRNHQCIFCGLLDSYVHANKIGCEMSENFYLKCVCGETSDYVRNGQAELKEAVLHALPLWLAWKHFDITGVAYDDIVGYNVIRFIVDHLEHGSFEIHSEYASKLREKVRPEIPDFKTLKEESKEKEIKKLVSRLLELTN